MNIENSTLKKVTMDDLNKKDLFSPITFTCPEDVKAIDEHAFDDVKGIVEVVDNINVEEIKPNTFRNCKKLRQVKFVTNQHGRSKLEKIDDCAFMGCINLRKFVVPEGVTELGRYVFANCTGLQVLTFPFTLKEINQKPIDGCKNLQRVTVDSGLFDCDLFSTINYQRMKNMSPERRKDINAKLFKLANLFFDIKEENGEIDFTPPSDKMKIDFTSQRCKEIFWQYALRQDPFTYLNIWIKNQADEMMLRGFLNPNLPEMTYKVIVGKNEPVHPAYHPNKTKPDPNGNRSFS